MRTTVGGNNGGPGGTTGPPARQREDPGLIKNVLMPAGQPTVGRGGGAAAAVGMTAEASFPTGYVAFALPRK